MEDETSEASMHTHGPALFFKFPWGGPEQLDDIPPRPVERLDVG